MMRWNKAFVVAVALQVACAATARHDATATPKEIRDFVEIDGATYFVDALTAVDRAGAKEACAAQNLTLVAFDDAREWNAVNAFLELNGLGGLLWWTDGRRGAGSSRWVWEATGEEVGFASWAEGQPNASPLLPQCIVFSADFQGYYDDFCTLDFLYALCE